MPIAFHEALFGDRVPSGKVERIDALSGERRSELIDSEKQMVTNRFGSLFDQLCLRRHCNPEDAKQGECPSTAESFADHSHRTAEFAMEVLDEQAALCEQLIVARALLCGI